MTTVFSPLLFVLVSVILVCTAFSKRLHARTDRDCFSWLPFVLILFVNILFLLSSVLTQDFYLVKNKTFSFSQCIKKLNEQAAELFESGEDREVNNGLIIMNEFIVPFLPLLLVDEMEEKDILAVEDMRNRWCSYLGQEMECKFKQC